MKEKVAHLTENQYFFCVAKCHLESQLGELLEMIASWPLSGSQLVYFTLNHRDAHYLGCFYYTSLPHKQTSFQQRFEAAIENAQRPPKVDHRLKAYI